jgi:DNA polymerase-4
MASETEPRLRWLLVDLNSYFASVEQELRPELRGRPVAVVPVMADTTCAIAASYEAKVFGVRTGTRVGDAKRMCPGIMLVEARHDVYVDYHNRIFEAVERCVPVAAVLSIDEMASSLIGREQPLSAALDLAKRVKISIRENVGSTLRCSIGLAPNRYLAKTFSSPLESATCSFCNRTDERDVPDLRGECTGRVSPLERENGYFPDRFP